jgi:hypothetical protein
MWIASLPSRYVVERTFPGRTQPPSWQGFSRTYRLAPHDGEGRQSDGEGTFAATRGNGEVAPEPAVHQAAEGGLPYAP